MTGASGRSGSGRRMEAAGACIVHGCASEPPRPGYQLCKPHWKADQAGELAECSSCETVFEKALSRCPPCSGSPAAPTSTASKDSTMSSTRLGKALESGAGSLSAQKINLLLAELGWIEKGAKGWKVTGPGTRLGAVQLQARGSGIPYVVWPPDIIENASLLRSVRELVGGAESEDGAERAPPELLPTTAEVSAAGSLPDFRTRFPAKYHTTDGHFVRSRGELLIDNWLYTQSLVHAYERRLPIAEEVFCDFYLPNGRVYIEYWGLENQPKYADRMEKKKAIYAQHEFRLISLNDDNISALDDTLPKLLLQYDIITS